MANNFSQPSVMKHLFSQAPKADLPRSSFQRDSGLKTAFDAGLLVPVYLDEILPGDSVNMDSTGFLRMATPIYPIFDNLFVDMFWFFCPNRLVFDNWVKLMGEQDNPDDSIDFTIPRVDPATMVVQEGDLGDYFGLPIADYTATTISSLPFKMYSLCWNQWFRDQNLQDSRPVDTGDTAIDYADYSTLARRGKRFDYFTSALPNPQKGVEVTLPLGTDAPLLPDATTGKWFEGATAGTPFDMVEKLGDPGNMGYNPSSALVDPDTVGITAYVDLSNATAVTINQMRLAITTQQFFEADARGGTRYTELNYQHFGVSNPDARLQRVELLAVNSTPIRSQAVSATVTVPTSDANGTTMGDPGATMTGLFKSGFTKSFTEHGYLFALCSVRADLNYQSGVEKHWSREDRFDFYFPTFAHLGEAPILNKEIYFQNTGSSGDDDLVFGYNEVWSEYKYKTSQITNQMRSQAATSLDAWHLAQEFTTLPLLDDTFIQENPPMDRVIAATDEPDFICDFYFKNKSARVMPVYSVPGLTRF